jgi:type I restriction enzyme S subunit
MMVGNDSLQTNDLVMVLSDVAHGNFLGLTDIIPSNKYVLNQRMAGLRIKDLDEVNPQFIRYFINKSQKYFKSKGQGSSQLNLSKSAVTDFPVLKPSRLKEQQKIAACLTSLDKVITAESQKLDILKDHKKGLLQNLLPQEGETIPKFRFKEFEDSGEWIETTLTQVADYENGKAHEQDIADDGEFIVVNSKFISQDGEVKKFTNTAFLPATKGDVLMVLSDIPNGKAIAKCFLVEEDNRYTVNQRICRITPRNVNSKILYYLLNRNPYFLAFDDGVKANQSKKR